MTVYANSRVSSWGREDGESGWGKDGERRLLMKPQDYFLLNIELRLNSHKENSFNDVQSPGSGQQECLGLGIILRLFSETDFLCNTQTEMNSSQCREKMRNYCCEVFFSVC